MIIWRIEKGYQEINDGGRLQDTQVLNVFIPMPILRWNNQSTNTVIIFSKVDMTPQ